METHERLFQLMLRHGTEAEREETRETMRILMTYKREHPEMTLEPMEALTLPSFLISRANQIAKVRHKRAQQWLLENKHGVIRTLEEEIRSVEAQFAACVMLGHEFNEATTHKQAKANGNIGRNVSAHCPRPGNYSLIVGEKEPPTRLMISLIVDGDHAYKCQGWVRAGEVQREEYQKSFLRGNVVSHPYVIPAPELSSLASWFG